MQLLLGLLRIQKQIYSIFQLREYSLPEQMDYLLMELISTTLQTIWLPYKHAVNVNYLLFLQVEEKQQLSMELRSQIFLHSIFYGTYLVDKYL